MKKLDIDDAIGAFPVHGMGGIWGILASGLFSRDQGGFYLASDANIFGVQCYGILAIVAWVMGITLPLFFVLKKVNLLRVSDQMEKEGLDATYHRTSVA